MFRTVFFSGSPGSARTRFHADRDLQLIQFKADLATLKKDLTDSVNTARTQLDGKIDQTSRQIDTLSNTVVDPQSGLVTQIDKANNNIDFLKKVTSDPQTGLAARIEVLDATLGTVGTDVVKISGVIGILFKPQLSPRQREALYRLEQHLVRVQNLATDKDFKLKQNNETLSRFGTDDLTRDCRAILGAASADLKKNFESLLQPYTRYNLEDQRFERYLHIQALRREIILFAAQLPKSSDETPPTEQSA